MLNFGIFPLPLGSPSLQTQRWEVDGHQDVPNPDEPLPARNWRAGPERLLACGLTVPDSKSSVPHPPAKRELLPCKPGGGGLEWSRSQQCLGQGSSFCPVHQAMGRQQEAVVPRGACSCGSASASITLGRGVCESLISSWVCLRDSVWGVEGACWWGCVSSSLWDNP